MVRTADVVDDFDFIMTCLKHTSGLPKPDFEQVAKELGAKGKNACYHRHWGIMKKWGMTGTRQSRANAIPDPGQKRRRAAPKKDAADDDNEDDELGESEKTPSQRKKTKMAAPAAVDSKIDAEDEADELA